MREEHYWPEWDSDPAELKAAPQAFSAYPAADTDEEFVDELLRPEPHAVRRPTRAKRFRRGVGRAFMIVGGAAVLFVVLYAADLMVSVGDVPRGVTVAGVDVGGLSRTAAESTLRDRLGPRLSRPIDLRAGDVETQLSPTGAGLGLDWESTVRQAGNQPFNPITRITSFFTTREVGVVTTSDDDKLHDALAELAKTDIDRDVIEGDIAFRPAGSGPSGDDVEPFVIEPRQGQRLADIDKAMALVKNHWLGERSVELPVAVTPPKATSDRVHAALDQTVRPMVSGPVRVRGEGKDAVLTPRDISDALRFAPKDDGSLRVTLDRARLQRLLRPQLLSTEKEARNARIRFTGSSPSIEQSEQGRRIDWEHTFDPFVKVAKRERGRDLPVVYDAREPDVTTKDARALGINEVIGEFTTGGLSGPAAHNVATMASAVNGAIVRPGETFSLDARTGPRTASQGYVVAPVDEDGTGRSVIGGGVSQLTTTLYNAAYLAGLSDAGHTPHAHYSDRYPPARDAISLREDGSSADLAFTNNLPKGVAVQAVVNGSTVTVKIWGTKRYRVESSTSRYSDLRPPDVERRRGEDCTPSAGALGFTVTDTRVLYDARSGKEVRRNSQTVTYQPKPAVICRGDRNRAR